MDARIPAEVFSPGDFIAEELDERSWTQQDLAAILGRPARTINELINGKRSVTARTARELAAAFDTSPDYWLNLQSAYDLSRERESQGEVSRRAKLFDLAPINEMAKRGWIDPEVSTDDLEKQVLSFFAISSIDEKPALKTAARKSADYTETSPPLTAWCFRAKHLAAALQVPQFSEKRFNRQLPDLLALRAHPHELRKVPEVLAEMGIRFVIVQHLSKTYVDGAASWLSENEPIIAMSLRYDRIDYFWFTLAHELMHVLHRDQGVVDQKLVGKERRTPPSEIEARADREGSELLVPPEKLESFIVRHRPRFSADSIKRFAKLHGVHPGIVVGQLQYRKEIPYSHHRRTLCSVRENIVPYAVTDGFGQTPITI